MDVGLPDMSDKHVIRPLGRRDAGGAIPKPLATMQYRSALSEAHAASFSDLLLRRSVSRSGEKAGAARC